MALARLLPCVVCLSVQAAGTALATEAPKDFVCLVEARQEVNVRAPVDGVLETVLVRRGSGVRRGQVIATLASGPDRANLELARWRASMSGDVNVAQTRVALAEKKWQRAEELVKQNFITDASRDDAESEYKLALEQLLAARENRRLAEFELKRAEELLNQRTIRSPVDGFVVDAKLQPGELAASNQSDPIVRLMEVDPLNVELILPVKAFGSIAVGHRARVTLEAPVGGTYPATVEVVDRAVDAASGTFRVRLRLPNPSGLIPAGVRCQAQF